MDDEQYKACVYEAMRHIFDIQRDFGRLFHEKIYQREAAFRIPGAQREVSIEARFEGFCKPYYLFLTGLPHGKLVNLRPERVEHEFINNLLTLGDRTSFQLSGDGWEEIRLNGRCLGPQRMPLAAPGVALRITALPPKQHARYRADLQQFLDHTDLRVVQWINITRPIVEFTTVRKAG